MQTKLENVLPQGPGPKVLLILAALLVLMILCTMCGLSALPDPSLNTSPATLIAPNSPTPTATATFAGLPVTGATPNATVAVPSITPSPTTALPPTPVPPTPVPPTPVPPTLTPSPTPVCLGTLSGFVYNDSNANGQRDGFDPPLPGLALALQNATGGVINVGVTNGAGAFQFVNLPAGAYRLQAAGPAGWSATSPSTVATMLACSGSFSADFGFFQPPTPTVTPSPTVALTGRVLDAKYGAPLSGAAVTLNGPVNTTAVSDVKGNYAANALVPGPYSLVAARTGYQNAAGSQVVVAGPNTFDWKLSPCVSLTDRGLGPRTVVAGQAITFTYALLNNCPVATTVWLGSLIRLSGTSQLTVDPTTDMSISVNGSSGQNFQRPFTVPANAKPGLYDAEWGVWESKVGTRLSGKYDGSDANQNQKALMVCAPLKTPVVAAKVTANTHGTYDVQINWSATGGCGPYVVATAFVPLPAQAITPTITDRPQVPAGSATFTPRLAGCGDNNFAFVILVGDSMQQMTNASRQVTIPGPVCPL